MQSYHSEKEMQVYTCEGNAHLHVCWPRQCNRGVRAQRLHAVGYQQCIAGREVLLASYTVSLLHCSQTAITQALSQKALHQAQCQCGISNAT
jgi:hypothetical protein